MCSHLLRIFLLYHLNISMECKYLDMWFLMHVLLNKSFQFFSGSLFRIILKKYDGKDSFSFFPFRVAYMLSVQIWIQPVELLEVFTEIGLMVCPFCQTYGFQRRHQTCISKTRKLKKKTKKVIFLIYSPNTYYKSRWVTL